MFKKLLQIVLILLIIIIVISVSFVSIESSKLNSVSQNNNFCQNYKSEKYSCPYNNNACQKLKQKGYPEFLCVFNTTFLDNFNFITFIKNLFNKEYNSEDIYNEIYFIKKDTRTVKTFDCKKDVSECKIDDNYIKIKNEGLIRISKQKDSDSYYFYTPYYFFSTFLKDIATNEIQINTYEDLLYQIEQIEINSCSDFTEKEINSKEYQTKCIFNKIANLDAIVSVLERTLFESVPETILQELYTHLKNIMIKQEEITMFEYILYISLDNKINNTNYKIKFLQK